MMVKRQRRAGCSRGRLRLRVKRCQSGPHLRSYSISTVETSEKWLEQRRLEHHGRREFSENSFWSVWCFTNDESV